MPMRMLAVALLVALSALAHADEEDGFIEDARRLALQMIDEALPLVRSEQSKLLDKMSNKLRTATIREGKLNMAALAWANPIRNRISVSREHHFFDLELREAATTLLHESFHLAKPAAILECDAEAATILVIRHASSSDGLFDFGYAAGCPRLRQVATCGLPVLLPGKRLQPLFRIKGWIGHPNFCDAEIADDMNHEHGFKYSEFYDGTAKEKMGEGYFARKSQEILEARSAAGRR